MKEEENKKNSKNLLSLINKVVSPIKNYFNEVQTAEPFFNKQNTPSQWIGRVVDDIKERGIFEGLHDITYPITKNRFVEPILEPIISGLRVANYKAGRPNVLINKFLGQTDNQMVVPNKPFGKNLTAEEEFNKKKNDLKSLIYNLLNIK